MFTFASPTEDAVIRYNLRFSSIWSNSASRSRSHRGLFVKLRTTTPAGFVESEKSSRKSRARFPISLTESCRLIVVELLAELPVLSATLSESVIVAGVVTSDGACHLTVAPVSVNVPVSVVH